MNLATLKGPGDFIGGHFVKPDGEGGTLVVKSPADIGEVVSEHPYSVRSVEQAVESARGAQRAWAKVPQGEREEVLRRYKQALESEREAFALIIAREVGKPLWDAESEVNALIAKIDLSIQSAQHFTATYKDDKAPGAIHYRPLGVIAVIGPFNFPAHLPNGQIVPALLHGNAVVFKPSDKAPSAGTLIAQCLKKAGLPPGVFNLVQGEARVAQALTTHEDIDGILFTGSREVGRAIVKANIDRPERLIALELGGKNPALVLDDADLTLAAKEITFAAFATAGQRCTATSRVYVARSNADDLIERIVKSAKETVVGYPLDDNVFMGPMISEASRNFFLRAQKDAQACGYECLAGGNAAEVSKHEGWYVKPSVHLAPKELPQNLVYQDQELFGPDLAIYVYESEEEAIAQANATPFGLAASVYSASRERFERIADEMEVGVVHFNRASTGASGRLSFGGVKQSGNHRPGGILMGQACVYPQARLVKDA